MVKWRGHLSKVELACCIRSFRHTTPVRPGQNKGLNKRAQRCPVCVCVCVVVDEKHHILLSDFSFVTMKTLPYTFNYSMLWCTVVRNVLWIAELHNSGLIGALLCKLLSILRTVECNLGLNLVPSWLNPALYFGCKAFNRGVWFDTSIEECIVLCKAQKLWAFTENRKSWLNRFVAHHATL